MAKYAIVVTLSQEADIAFHKARYGSLKPARLDVQDLAERLIEAEFHAEEPEPKAKRKSKPKPEQEEG